MKADSLILHQLGFHVTGDLGPFTFYTSRLKGLVWFPRSPPLEPPSPLQIHQRNKFRRAARLWHGLDPSRRNQWKVACQRANLAITYYNFFVYYVTTNDVAAVETIEQQSGLNLLPLNPTPLY